MEHETKVTKIGKKQSLEVLVACNTTQVQDHESHFKTIILLNVICINFIKKNWMCIKTKNLTV
jgi:hypothetical protein